MIAYSEIFLKLFGPVDIYLILLAVSVFMNLILGVYILYRLPNSYTSYFLFGFCLINSVWAIDSHVSYIIKKYSDSFELLFLLRLVLTLACLQSLFIYLFSVSYPDDHSNLSRLDKLFIIPGAVVVGLLSLPGLYFQGFYLENGVYKVLVNPAIMIFANTAISLLLAAGKNFYQKYLDSGNDTSILFILLGHILMFTATVVFSFIFPAILENEKYLPLSSAFSIPFVMLAISGLLKNNLLKIKITFAEVMIFLFWIATFVRIFFYTNLNDMLIDLAMFMIWIFFGLFMIKSFRREISEKDDLIELYKNNQEKTDRVIRQKNKLEDELVSKEEVEHSLVYELHRPVKVLKTILDTADSGNIGLENLEIVRKEVNRINKTVDSLLKFRK